MVVVVVVVGREGTEISGETCGGGGGGGGGWEGGYRDLRSDVWWWWRWWWWEGVTQIRDKTCVYNEQSGCVSLWSDRAITDVSAAGRLTTPNGCGRSTMKPSG